MLPQLPVQLSTQCTRTDTLHSDPIWFFEGTCHETQSQTNRHPSINPRIRRGQPLSVYIHLFSTCSLTPSFRESMRPLPQLIRGAYTLPRAVARRQFLCVSTVRFGLARHTNWYTDGGGGLEA